MISEIINLTIATLIGLVMICSASPSWAHQVEEANTQIDGTEARNITRQYLNSLGYSRPGTSVFSASVGKAILQEDTWIVRVLTGNGQRLPNKKGVVLINAFDGQVKQNLKD